MLIARDRILRDNHTYLLGDLTVWTKHHNLKLFECPDKQLLLPCRKLGSFLTKNYKNPLTFYFSH